MGLLIEESNLRSMAEPRKSNSNSPGAVELAPQDTRYPDGFSFYRALARHTIGDPTYYESVLHAVQTHYWRVLVDKNNPYHNIYKPFEGTKFGTETKFFNALSSPDFWLCPAGWQNGSQSIMLVVTNALNIKLVLWGEDKAYFDDGPVVFPEYLVKFPHDTRDKLTRTCSALSPVNDGRALISFLERERLRLENEMDKSALKIRRMAWWLNPEWLDHLKANASNEPVPATDTTEWNGPEWNELEWNEPEDDAPEPPPKYLSYNEYASEYENFPDLVKNLDSFVVFTVVVRYPAQIRSALRLLDEALRRAPGQEGQVSGPVSQGSCQTRPLKRYVALDAEFKKVYLGKEAVEEIEQLEDPVDRTERLASNPEYLCSILTVAVDRQLVLSFYLLDMLENPTEGTVEEVSYLFEKLVFNTEYLKLWFNFQQDISVLDATIAHMYQATPRERFQEYVWKEKSTHWVCPTWKINSAWYQNHRPRPLNFPRFRSRVDSCDLHQNKPEPPFTRLNAHGLSCPCRKTGNVDITTVFEFLSRQLGYKSGSKLNSDQCDKRLWHQVRTRCNYGSFLRSTMQTDRLYEIFEYLKDSPGRSFKAAAIAGSSQSSSQFIDEWYQSLGPGMETDNDKMGYNIGDVAGVALLMRFLTTTDDRMLFVTSLVNFLYCGDFDNQPSRRYPQQKPKLSRPAVGLSNGYMCLNDYPKSWIRRMIGNDPYPYPDALSNKLAPRKVGDIFQGREDVDRRLVSHFEHDSRAKAGRKYFERAKKLYGGAGPGFPKVTKVALDAVRAELFDPLDYSLPRWFTYEAAQPIRSLHGRLPLIRAGVTTYEDLLTLIQDIKNRDPDAQIQLPTTQDGGNSYWFGLPRYIGTKPAGEPFQLPDTRIPLSPVKPAPLSPIEPEAEPTLPADAQSRREEVRVLHDDWKLERYLDEEYHLKAAQTRFDDIFDPRGRKYRRDWHMTEDGKSWESPPPPDTAPDKEPSDKDIPSDEEPFEIEGGDSPAQSYTTFDEEPFEIEGGDSPAQTNTTFDEEQSVIAENGWGPEDEPKPKAPPDEVPWKEEKEEKENKEDKEGSSHWSKHARFEGDGLSDGLSDSDSMDEKCAELYSRPSKRARLGF